MNEPTQRSITERSTTVRFGRWLFSRRGLRALVLTLIWPITLVALFYAVENWRGASAWRSCKNELEARGEKLEFAAYIPQPAPDSDNFAAIPEIRAWFERTPPGEQPKQRPKDAYERAGSMVPQSNGRYKGPRVMTDLVAWQQAFEAAKTNQTTGEFSSPDATPAARAAAAPTVLEALRENEPLFAALRAASPRPRSVYPLNYDAANPWAILLPHLAHLRGTAQRLQLKACAELAAGQSDQALADIQLILTLADSLREEKLLISHLVRIATTAIALQPVWEGLVEHRWSEPQLEQLQRELERRNLMTDRTIFGAERACGLAGIDYLQKHGDFDMFNGSENSEPSAANFIARLMPRGWYAFEKRNYTRLLDLSSRTGWNYDQRRVEPAVVDQNQKALERELSISPWAKVFQHKIAAAMLAPAVGRVIQRGAIAQTLLHEAALACALERFHLANGKYPDRLEQLTPQFIQTSPHDLVTGNPLVYSVGPGDTYRLYSVGWNGKDDGGQPDLPMPNDKSPDWVWAIPAVTPTAK